MGSLKRKMARGRVKRAKKEMKEQLAMFGEIGQSCNVCNKSFNKKLKEHVTTWNVVVREEEKVVRLYCPECWAKANKIIEEIQNDLRIQSERGSEGPDESESQ